MSPTLSIAPAPLPRKALAPQRRPLRGGSNRGRHPVPWLLLLAVLTAAAAQSVAAQSVAAQPVAAQSATAQSAAAQSSTAQPSPEPPGPEGSAEAVPGDLATDGGLSGDIPLSLPVQRTLRQIQKQWVEWMSAFYSDQPERLEAVVEGLLQDARELGVERLPDLAIGAGVVAVKAEAAGNSERVEWALEAADRLDPGRPETAFARARVRWDRGQRFGAFVSEIDGYRRLFGTAAGRAVAGANLALWLIFALLTGAGLFIALQMAVKGRRLFADLEALLGRVGGLPVPLLRLLVLPILLWPLLLPGGVLWLLLYWSALLFVYGSLTERTAFALSWVLIALAPLAMAHQRQQVELTLSPPMRGLDALVEQRLHGRAFQDLGRLAVLLPEDPAVIQLIADLHRELGQWDIALKLYRRVLLHEPDNVWAEIDIGGYYFFKEDYRSARRHFQTAVEAATQKELDRESVVAYYNLSQAFYYNRLFDEAQVALQEAQGIDAGMVGRLQQQTGQQQVVTFSGGVARAPEIRRRLAGRLLHQQDGADADEDGAEEGEEGEEATARIWGLFVPVGPLAGVLGAAALAGLLLWVRAGAAGAAPGDEGWPLRDAVIPGLASVRDGRGLRAFSALLIPVLLVTLPLVEELGYPMFPSLAAPGLALWILAGMGLVLYFGVRLVLSRLA